MSAFEAGRWAPGSVAAIGKFDGLHRGHQRIIARAMRRAKALKTRCLVVTFDPAPDQFRRLYSLGMGTWLHPTAKLRRETHRNMGGTYPLVEEIRLSRRKQVEVSAHAYYSYRPLVSAGRKVALLGEAGVDGIVLVPFNESLACLSPESFSRRTDAPSLAARRLSPQLLVAFGRGQLCLAVGQALGQSHTTVRSYVDLLEHAFLLRVLQPLEANLKKRLVRSPKVYLRDSGLLHALLELPSARALLGHPVYGASWEGFVIENALAVLGRGWRASFYRTADGAELDLVLEKAGKRLAVECKASSAPAVTRGFWTALSDLHIKEAFVVAPVARSYPIGRGARVVSLPELLAELSKLG